MTGWGVLINTSFNSKGKPPFFSKANSTRPLPGSAEEWLPSSPIPYGVGPDRGSILPAKAKNTQIYLDI